MMYDFHYPSGRGKLNEDTVNCRAEQSGMMGKNAGPGSFFRFFCLCSAGGKNGAFAVARLWSPPTPPNITARRSSPPVHKSRAAYSWNYPESSTCNKQTDRFRPDCITLSVQVTSFPALLSFPPHLYGVSPDNILNFLETPRTHLGYPKDENKSGV